MTAGSFAKIPHDVLVSALSDRAVRLYGLLRCLGWRDGHVVRSRQELAAALRCSPDSVDRATTELRRAGHLEVHHRTGPNGHRTASRYRVLDGHPLRTGADARVGTHAEGGIRTGAVLGGTQTRTGADARARTGAATKEEIQTLERDLLLSSSSSARGAPAARSDDDDVINVAREVAEQLLGVWKSAGGRIDSEGGWIARTARDDVGPRLRQLHEAQPTASLAELGRSIIAEKSRDYRGSRTHTPTEPRPYDVVRLECDDPRCDNGWLGTADPAVPCPTCRPDLAARLEVAS